MLQFPLMRELLKTTLKKLPLSLKKLIVVGREAFWSKQKPKPVPNPSLINTELLLKNPDKKNVLVYAIFGLRHAGTEKNLQLMANSLADDFNVYFMYGEEPESEARKQLLDSRIKFIPFTYTQCEIKTPHLIHEMNPDLTTVVENLSINLLITASPGYSHYPWNQIKNIPIVLLNIFGAPTLQKNIKAVIYNSLTTKRHAEVWIGEDKRGYVKYAPLYKTPLGNYQELGMALRRNLNIPTEDFVFGRIGRDDDAIFDPIGIRAWQSIALKYPKAHYVIMSPSPALIKIVEEEKVPRVHLLPKSSKEEDVWAFHGAIDTLAHFRFDGETSGVAIAESMYVGNPIISHRSHIWNAHLEYLNDSFSRVANRDDISSYAKFMEEFIDLKANHKDVWTNMQKQAYTVAVEKFSPQAYGGFVKKLVNDILNKN